MRILIADDHPLYREAASTQISRLFKDAVVEEASTIDELRELADGPGAPVDLFLIDFNMPGMSIGAIELLVDRFPNTPIAVISGTAQKSDIRAAVEAGARGFIPKTATGDYLAHALKLMLAGGTSVPTELLFNGPVSESAIPDDTAPPWLSLLTPRERDVLVRVARGLSNKEIGRELSLAEVTIKLHLRSLFRKMGARSRADAAVMAAKAGLA
jgi:DNA-binding NarL/FixJ family response regulator